MKLAGERSVSSEKCRGNEIVESLSVVSAY